MEYAVLPSSLNHVHILDRLGKTFVNRMYFELNRRSSLLKVTYV